MLSSLVASAYKDFASFLTAMLVSSAFALPLIFAHTGLISNPACWMSLIGGALVYGTILVFTGVFVRPSTCGVCGSREAHCSRPCARFRLQAPSEDDY